MHRICLDYPMIRFALRIYLAVLALFISASVTIAAECADDPNECTLKKLCEVATTVDGGNTIWSAALESSKHVKVAQSLGMECDVSEAAVALEGVENVLTQEQMMTAESKCEDWYTGKNDDRSFWARSPLYVLEHCINRFGINYRDYVGHTPLHLAVTHRNPKIENIEYLLERGTDVNITRKMLGTVQTPLISAITLVKEPTKQSAIILLLVKYGADVTKANSLGVSPLKAYKGNNPEIIAALSKNRTFQPKKNTEPASRQITNKKTHFSKSNFISLSSIQRKQLQYGLKELGYYSSSIDGLYGPKTEKAVRDYARSKGINSGYPNSVYRRIVSEVNVPNSFAVAQRPTTSSSSGSSSPSAGSNLFKKLAVGAAVVFVCSKTPNAEACLDGALDTAAGSNSNNGSSRSSPNTSPSSSSASSDKQCDYDFDCTYGEKCIKNGYGKSMCVAFRDSKGSIVRSGNKEPQQCSSNQDCSSGYKCDWDFKICLKR